MNKISGRKVLNIKHHFDDYECMWNGIEDLYINQMGEELPPSFFFYLSGFGSFCYLKQDKKELKRMIAFGDGRTKKMYEFLAPIVGFTYKHYECSNFMRALEKAKKEIDNDHPCILGALDMFYLPYFKKLYHGEHIPFHYVMMIGYDDEKEEVYILDCGRKETLSLAYNDLALSWDCQYPGLSKPYTICTVNMNANKNIYELTKEALRLKKEGYLNPPVKFLGYSGFIKFIDELPSLREKLGKDDYDLILSNLVEFLGTVPNKPNALKGIDEPDEMEYHGGFEKASVVLNYVGSKYQNESMIKVAKIYDEAGNVISVIKDIIVNYLVNKKDETNKLKELFTKVADALKEGYEILILE